MPYPQKEYGTRDTLHAPRKDMEPFTRKGPGTRDTLSPHEQKDACQNITFPQQ